MVMRILGTTSNGNVQFLRSWRTGQDSTGQVPTPQDLTRQVPTRQVQRARLILRDTHSWELSGRRKLRQINVVHQAELAYVQSIEVDAALLTGKLDLDITLLDIVA